METERTGWHRKVERWLTEEGIAFTSECTDYPPYKLDIYLSDAHVAIEIDGPGHLKSRDEKRDGILACQYNLPVFRLKATRGLIKDRTMHTILDFLATEARSPKGQRREA